MQRKVNSTEGAKKTMRVVMVDWGVDEEGESL